MQVWKQKQETSELFCPQKWLAFEIGMFRKKEMGTRSGSYVEKSREHEPPLLQEKEEEAGE